MPLALANRYARALVDVVLAPGSGVEADTAVTQLKDFAAMVDQSAELRTVLLSPAVAGARKRAVVAGLGEKLGLPRPVRNFLFVVIDHRRIAHLKEMAEALEGALDERLGRVSARVSSASVLGQPQREKLQRELSAATGKQVRCEYQVEPGLLGGVSVRVGSTIYDGSVRGRLDALRDRMRAE
ncbi:MAG: ATP synthase F1 subunit delta [Acidimicrobiia bacterium]|nr:ATP synthase F1 subunit delta [Acidimicrobiia bacterium]